MSRTHQWQAIVNNIGKVVHRKKMAWANIKIRIFIARKSITWMHFQHDQRAIPCDIQEHGAMTLTDSWYSFLFWLMRMHSDKVEDRMSAIETHCYGTTARCNEIRLSASRPTYWWASILWFRMSELCSSNHVIMREVIFAINWDCDFQYYHWFSANISHSEMDLSARTLGICSWITAVF